MIEVPHPQDVESCARIVKVFLATGSHFLTHADWGCMDGVHSAWMTVDADTKEEARSIVPPPFRAQAKIIGLNTFTMDQINDVLQRLPH